MASSFWLSMVKQKRIIFYVNDQPFERQYGATVKHAVIAYDQRILKDIRELRAWVVDARGDRVGLRGALENGARLYIRYVDNSWVSDSSRDSRYIDYIHKSKRLGWFTLGLLIRKFQIVTRFSVLWKYGKDD